MFTMKAAMKLYKNDGESELGFPVKLILTHNRKPKRRTISHAKLRNWDETKNQPRTTHPDFEYLFSLCMDIQKYNIQHQFKSLEDYDLGFNMILKDQQKVTNNFLDWCDRCIELMQKQGRFGNAKSYQNSKDALERYAENISFTELTSQFLNEWKNFLRNRGNENKTIKHYGVGIRAMYNRAVTAGITEDKKPFRGFFNDIPTRDRRKKNRYLDNSQILLLEKADLPPAQRRSVDLSLLQFYLGGADLVDIYYLKWNDITENRVFLSRRKLGEKAYEFDVLFTEKAKSIVNKYGVPGKVYVFPYRKDEKGYDTFYNNHRRALKNVQDKLKLVLQPKNDNLTSKVMRHSFATLGKFKRYEEDLLRELMGHERNEVDTIYKDKYPEAERDAAQLDITGE